MLNVSVLLDKFLKKFNDIIGKFEVFYSFPERQQ